MGAADLVRDYGLAAMQALLEGIASAVRLGDDHAVSRLDRLLQTLE